MGFFRDHAPVLLAVGTGVAVGTTVTVLYHRYWVDRDRELLQLSAKLERLRQEVQSLRKLIEDSFLVKNSKKKASGPASVVSARGSSGEDDDDEFEEAYGEPDYLTSTKSSTVESFTSAEAARTQSSPDSLVCTEELFSEVDKLLEGTDADKEKAYELLRHQEPQLGTNADFMWRFTKSMYVLSAIRGESEGDGAKRDLVYKSHDYASRSLVLDEKNASVHKWYAITIAGVGDYESTQVKLQNGFKYRDHIEQAIKLNPSDATAYYLLGRWLYAVYMLSWIERQAAATLFGANISANIEDALHQFVEAENLQPGKWKDNQLHIAKCYIEMRDYYTAWTWLDKANSIATISQDDKVAQKEVDSLLYKYSGYKS